MLDEYKTEGRARTRIAVIRLKQQNRQETKLLKNSVSFRFAYNSIFFNGETFFVMFASPVGTLHIECENSA
jgi:hypothetical protein